MRSRFCLLITTILTAGLLPVTLANTLPTEVYEYRVGIVPWDAGQEEQCKDEAAAMGHRFAQGSGLNVVSTSCSEQNRYGYTASVFYLSEFQVESNPNVHRAWVSFSYQSSTDPDEEGLILPEDQTGGDMTGMYADFPACAASIDKQVALYREMTGLEPIVVYCAEAVTEGYALHIDGFGVPRTLPRHFSANSGDVPNSDFLTGVSQLLQENGATIAEARISGYDTSIVYYSNDLNYLDIPEIATGWLLDSTECDEQLASGKEAFTSLGSPPVLLNCFSDGIGTRFFPKFVFRMPIVPEIPAPLWVHNLGPSYNSYGDCMADRASLSTSYAAATGHRVGGIFCLANDAYSPQYQAVILSQP